MRSVSILALAVGAGAFAPSTLSRPSTALAVHRPRVAAPNTSIQTSIAAGRAVAWLRYGRRTAPNYTPRTPPLSTNAASIDLTARGATGRPSRSLEAPPRPLTRDHRRQLKAAKKANRLRPKKKMPSDINRKPPPYDVEPQYYEGRPDEYVVESEGSDDFDKNAHIAKVLADLEAQADYDNTDAAEEEKIMASVKYPDPAAAFVAMAK